MAKSQPPQETREVQLLTWILEEIQQERAASHCVCPKLEEVVCLLRSIDRKIDQLLPEPAGLTDKIQIVFGGIMPATPGTVAVGSTVVASIVPLEADGVTVTPGATLSAQGYTVDDPTIASFVVNADGTATFTGVTAGIANVAATATVTDADGAVATFTTTNVLTVTAVVPPTGLTTSIQLNFA